MTVADLIKELQKLDQDKEIWFYSGMAGECNPMGGNPFYEGTVSSIQDTYGNGNYSYKFWNLDINPNADSKSVVLININ